jgi:glutathione-regulated potassium-efflux system ancillary protein KefC
VALFQDLGGIIVITLLPLLAVQQAVAAGGSGWLTAAKAVAMVLAIIFGGRLLLRPALRWIARSETPEIFTAASLLLVVATASLMQAVGLSMALGAFLAGVLLAESEYRRQLETDLEPFKGLLLGLFFIAVGMSIDFAVVLANPGLVAAVVLGFLLLKAVVGVAWRGCGSKSWTSLMANFMWKVYKNQATSFTINRPPLHHALANA